MVTHFFLYRAVVAMTSIWSRIDWAYKWFNITWEVGSGSNTGSLLSVTSLFSTMLSKCGGKIGGPECPPLEDFWSSKFGLFWPQPFSGYLLSLLEKNIYTHEDLKNLVDWKTWQSFCHIWKILTWLKNYHRLKLQKLHYLPP